MKMKTCLINVYIYLLFQSYDNIAAQMDGPCIEMFEEKQLLAMNSELQDALAMERRSINRLLRQIHQEETSAKHPVLHV
jgi:hypothetical protein